MYISSAEFKGAYLRMQAASLVGGCTVLILAAPDVDAIAAARILTVRMPRQQRRSRPPTTLTHPPH